MARYYQHGPVAAGYIDAHQYLKPLVRALLAPLVLFALLVLSISPVGIGVVLALLVAFVVRRRRAS